MNGWVVFAVTVALIVLSAFFVVIEFGLLGARRNRLEQQASTSGSARAALRGMNELTVMLAGAQFGITACTFALGAITKPAVDSSLGPVLTGIGIPEWLAGGAAFFISLLVVTFLHLVIGEMAPKSWAIAHPEVAARVIGTASRAYIWPLRPFLNWVNQIANFLVRKSGIDPVERAAVGGRDAQTIRHLVEHSTQVGVLEPELTRHLTEALELQALTVAEATKLNSSPTAVAADARVGEVRTVARDSGHLRILIADQSPSGYAVVHVRDTLLSDEDEPAAQFARPAYRLDASTPAYEAMGQMREQSIQLALVERDGELLGLVTLADLFRKLLPPEGVLTRS